MTLISTTKLGSEEFFYFVYELECSPSAGLAYFCMVEFFVFSILQTCSVREDPVIGPVVVYNEG